MAQTFVARACPWLPLSGPLGNWDLDEPACKSLDIIRAIRDKIEVKGKIFWLNSNRTCRDLNMIS